MHSTIRPVLPWLAAYFFGEFANSYVLAKMKIATKGKWLWTRTIGSTIVGEAVDTTIFFIIATILGVFSSDLLPSLIVANYILKVGIEVLFTPVTLRIVNWLKRIEQEDFYDTETQFNPFRFDA